MKRQRINKNSLEPKTTHQKKDSVEGYPLYPSSDDIYLKNQKEDAISVDKTQRKELTENLMIGKNNELDFEEDVSGNDLDVPGSELDDQQEDIGSEDEENNIYSIGGDRHEDIDENLGNEKI